MLTGIGMVHKDSLLTLLNLSNNMAKVSGDADKLPIALVVNGDMFAHYGVQLYIITTIAHVAYAHV